MGFKPTLQNGGQNANRESNRLEIVSRSKHYLPEGEVTMHRHVITDGSQTYTRVSKVEARKLFTAGKPFYVIAVKMRPGFPFSLGMVIDPVRYQDEGRGFDWMVSNFQYYNCDCNETGTYAAFYLVTAR